MARPAAALALSRIERAILEAIVDAKETPRRVRERGRIIVLAGAGVGNAEIARQVEMGRPAVLRIRRRFQERGIRGLWDDPRPGPREGIAPEIEAAIVGDSLYRDIMLERSPPDAALRWTVRNLAKKYGVDAATVQRTWTRHGIKFGRRGRLLLDKLKISEDPLFGVTVTRLAGVFHEGLWPVLALMAVPGRPLAEVEFSELPRKAINEKVKILLRALEALIPKLHYAKGSARHPERSLWGIYAAYAQQGALQQAAAEKFIRFLEDIDGRRAAAEEIYLIAEYDHDAGYSCAAVGEWLAGHPQFHIQYAPTNARGRAWSDWPRHWFEVITAMPVQAALLDSIAVMTERLGTTATQ